MSVEVPFVLKTSTTPLVFAHETEFCLVCDLMLLQSAFELGSFDHSPHKRNEGHCEGTYACQVKIVLQFFCRISHNQQSRGPSYDVH